MAAKVLKNLFVFKEVSCGVWGVSLVRERFFGLHERMCYGLNLSSCMLKAHEVMRCITGFIRHFARDCKRKPIPSTSYLVSSAYSD
jgi:hypothetical protein